MDMAEIAWAAGLFEGEGCITGVWKGDRFYPRIQLSMTDHDVVTRFAAIMGIGTISEPRVPDGRKQKWVWYAAGWPALTDFAIRFRGFLGMRRRARLDEVLGFYKAGKRTRHTDKDRCPQGHAYRGANLYLDPRGYRHCRICRRERKRKVRR